MTEYSLTRRLLLGAAAATAVSLPAVLLGVLAVDKWGPLRRLDHDTADRLNGWALTRPGAVHALQTIQTVLAPNTFRIAVVVAAMILWVKGGRRVAAWALLALIVGGALGVLLKQLVGRARPAFDSPVETAASYSFPSGHALNSMLGVAIILVLLLPALNKAWTALAWAVGAAIVLIAGYDRIALGVHYVSDVLAGWVVALAVVVGTATAFQAWRRDTGRGTTNPMSEGLEPTAQSR